MKKSKLKEIIKECMNELLTEDNAKYSVGDKIKWNGNVYTVKNTDVKWEYGTRLEITDGKGITVLIDPKLSRNFKAA